MTKEQKEQFNNMLQTLNRIAYHYQTPDDLRESSKSDFGLEYEEAIEMAYENIQSEAFKAIDGVEEIP